MKCVNCGETTKGSLITCPDCSNLDSLVKVLSSHVCGSFFQVENEVKGSCRNFYMCKPIKMALQNKPLIEPGIGHVVCPYPSINLGKIMHSEMSEDMIKNNYSECMD